VVHLQFSFSLFILGVRLSTVHSFRVSFPVICSYSLPIITLPFGCHPSYRLLPIIVIVLLDSPLLLWTFSFAPQFCYYLPSYSLVIGIPGCCFALPRFALLPVYSRCVPFNLPAWILPHYPLLFPCIMAFGPLRVVVVCCIALPVTLPPPFIHCVAWRCCIVLVGLLFTRIYYYHYCSVIDLIELALRICCSFCAVNL